MTEPRILLETTKGTYIAVDDISAIGRETDCRTFVFMRGGELGACTIDAPLAAVIQRLQMAGVQVITFTSEERKE